MRRPLLYLAALTLIIVAAFLRSTTDASAAVSRVTRMVTLPFSARVNGGATNIHTFYVGYDDDRVIVRGDHDTDLDCWVYDENGRLVDSDTDDTDICYLETPGVGEHQLRIRNYGRVYNAYTVRRR